MYPALIFFWMKVLINKRIVIWKGCGGPIQHEIEAIGVGNVFG